MRCLVPVAPDSSSYRVWFFKIRVYLGGPVAPICTINKTKSSSSCLQLELVLFYYLRPRNTRAVTRQHHENSSKQSTTEISPSASELTILITTPTGKKTSICSEKLYAWQYLARIIIWITNLILSICRAELESRLLSTLTLRASRNI